MNGNSVSLSSDFLNPDSFYVVRAVFERLADAQNRAAALRANLKAAYEMIADTFKGQEIALMLRNRWGLSKKEAQKLYNDLRSPGEEPSEDTEKKNPNQNPPKPTGTVEDKISMIMDYMKDTSAKLDSIDRDIAHLKVQVEEILKRI